jgi:hypothetical protein
VRQPALFAAPGALQDNASCHIRPIRPRQSVRVNPPAPTKAPPNHQNSPCSANPPRTGVSRRNRRIRSSLRSLRLLRETNMVVRQEAADKPVIRISRSAGFTAIQTEET